MKLSIREQGAIIDAINKIENREIEASCVAIVYDDLGHLISEHPRPSSTYKWKEELAQKYTEFYTGASWRYQWADFSDLGYSQIKEARVLMLLTFLELTS